MSKLLAALWGESLITRRSKIFWITIIAFTFIPIMLGLLMFVQLNPDVSGKVGLLGTKASMLKVGDAGWPGYFNLINQTISALGMLGFGLVISWIFGREYSDNTIKDILALPVSRTSIVTAKFLVSALWFVLLGFVFIVSAFSIGLIIHLPGWEPGVIINGIRNYSVVLFLTLLVSSPVAFFASYGKGFLVPIGFVIFILIIANFTGLAGLGPYFPWAIPGIHSAPSGMEGMQPNTISYILLFATSILGVAGTISWWQYADQK